MSTEDENYEINQQRECKDQATAVPNSIVILFR